MSLLTDESIAAELNRLYAEEVEGAIRYQHLCAAVRGLDRLLVEKVLRDGVTETLEHAQVIAQKLRSLGHVPRLEITLTCPAEPLSAREALRQALTFEEAALDAYQDLLRKVDGDIPLEEFIRSQIAVEAEHVAQLKELLSE